MSFMFTLATGADDAADRAFEMPPLPYGVSYPLREAIEAYTAIVLGADGRDEDAFSAINDFVPKSLADVAAKLLYSLHYEARGAYGERLLIICTPELDGRIAAAESTLADLYKLMPQDWGTARTLYDAAVVAEDEYARRVWDDAFAAQESGGSPISAAIDAEMLHLQDARFNAALALLDMPAPSLEEFALKYLICFDGDRDLRGRWRELCTEAKRLLAEVKSYREAPDARA